MNFYLPKGAKINYEGLQDLPGQRRSRSKRTREGCPKGSEAGPAGKVLGVVAFGQTRVPEEAEVKSFYAPGGGLSFFTFGHDPVVAGNPVDRHSTPR